jgi:hypothetical protein
MHDRESSEERDGDSQTTMTTGSWGRYANRPAVSACGKNTKRRYTMLTSPLWLGTTVGGARGWSTETDGTSVAGRELEVDLRRRESRARRSRRVGTAEYSMIQSRVWNR